jgi:hypothetical protein
LYSVFIWIFLLTYSGLSTYDYVLPDLTKNRDFADQILFADKLAGGVPSGPMSAEEDLRVWFPVTPNLRAWFAVLCL